MTTDGGTSQEVLPHRVRSRCSPVNVYSKVSGSPHGYAFNYVDVRKRSVEIQSHNKFILIVIGNIYKAPCIRVENLLKGANNIKRVNAHKLNK